uniref:Uncharacterized protein n=1 Tax=Glossina palpalis gambiensis TaxID=67801 RepID=A0A1B0B8M8_9MUSC
MANKHVSARSLIFESMPYKLLVLLITHVAWIIPVCGKFMTNTTHIYLLILSPDLIPSTFEYCDFVSTTTHNTLCSPPEGNSEKRDSGYKVYLEVVFKDRKFIKSMFE